jgi:hypothetical protein
MRATASAVLLVLCGAVPAASAERTIVVLVPTAADERLAPAHEAIRFWNDVLADLGVAIRLGAPRVVVASPVARTVENYARQIAQRAFRLPAGAAEPRPPDALTGLGADVVVLLSRQDIMSFTWPMPKVDPPRHLIVIRSVRAPYRTDAMVSRHVVAHELGHAIGLGHNNDPHTLMCGPCQPLTAESDDTGFLPLTDADRARLVELHGAR